MAPVVNLQALPQAEAEEPLLLCGRDVLGRDEDVVVGLEFGAGCISEGALDLRGVVAFAQVAGEPLELEGDRPFSPGTPPWRARPSMPSSLAPDLPCCS